MFIRFFVLIVQKWRRRNCIHVSSKTTLQKHIIIYNPSNLYMEDNTRIARNSIIMNTRAKFIMRKGSSAAFGLCVITGNHISIVGMHKNSVNDSVKDKYDVKGIGDRDIVIDEEVWIASNVTLLPGTHISRGCIVGSGAVVRSGYIPPYSIIIGNPAKIVGFRFTPEEIVRHESILYDVNDRLQIEDIEDNYKKYYLDKIQEIKRYKNGML